MQAGREDADDEASRSYRAVTERDDSEMASRQATEQETIQALANCLGVSLSKAGEMLENVKRQVRQEHMGQECSALDS